MQLYKTLTLQNLRTRKTPIHTYLWHINHCGKKTHFFGYRGLGRSSRRLNRALCRPVLSRSFRAFVNLRTVWFRWYNICYLKYQNISYTVVCLYSKQFNIKNSSKKKFMIKITIYSINNLLWKSFDKDAKILVHEWRTIFLIIHITYCILK